MLPMRLANMQFRNVVMPQNTPQAFAQMVRYSVGAHKADAPLMQFIFLPFFS